MTGPEHYDEAERLLEQAVRRDSDGSTRVSIDPAVYARIQVHATLALAWATDMIATGRDS